MAEFVLDAGLLQVMSPCLCAAVDRKNQETTYLPKFQPEYFSNFVEWLNTKQIESLSASIRRKEVNRSWWFTLAKTYTLANRLHVLDLGNYLIHLAAQPMKLQNREEYDRPGRDTIREVYESCHEESGLRRLIVAMEAYSAPLDMAGDRKGWETIVDSYAQEFVIDVTLMQHKISWGGVDNPFLVQNFEEQFYDNPSYLVGLKTQVHL